MVDRLAAFIVGEGNWLPLAMGGGFAATAVLWLAMRDAVMPPRRRILALMNLFTGVMLLVMGCGHLLAVATRQLEGSLRGSPLLFYAIGIAIVVPAWSVAQHTRTIPAAGDGRLTAKLNGWMAATLALLGIVNLPLAVPSLCNVVYSLHRRRWVGWSAVVVFLVASIGLFIGGVLFMASGRTFEEFSTGR